MEPTCLVKKRQSGASSRSLLSNLSPTLKAASQINAEFSSLLLSLIRLSCPRWVAGKQALGQIGILGFFSESEIVGQEGDGVLVVGSKQHRLLALLNLVLVHDHRHSSKGERPLRLVRNSPTVRQSRVWKKLLIALPRRNLVVL